ncbi:urea ABC transporter permease subunit UrtC [Microbispora hainanensis]|uniref:Urea ABC transporter permease subunit UrtC n=1 Tax=Microbispora hainanensis TaxID=568844 RepID=A0ABZ1SST4_9ACTN|nr:MULTISPECIES: urea ABC transporter permease subunit UrtC [Microbispora]NJP27411.1 urea ABC transporter permease subunit UrtC [Microbispora sp. CL1-1]TQS11199.1 urea ABC transporter permease subunit UrtC [Microbispora sp. SCL1-1]
MTASVEGADTRAPVESADAAVPDKGAGAAAPDKPVRRWQGPAVFTAVAVLALVVAPLLLEPFRLGLLAKYLCYAIVALGIGLAWGQGGMLTLGQGVFFGLGGYAMGMYLKLNDAGGDLPDFMVWSGVEELPALWKPFGNPVFALAMVVVLPVVVALLLGALVFRQRVRGAYFAILTQALAAALVILLVGQQGLTGGTNGLTNFFDFFGRDVAADETQRGLYLLVAVVLGVLYLGARQLVRSRFGRLLLAVRDGEDRVRFLGYNPATVKTLTFAVSAGMAGIAGALFVPVVGIISPALLGVVPSLELVVAVAVGGRFALAGAVLGAVVMGYARTYFSEELPDAWLYLQGALFVLVMTLAPKGIAGLAAGLVRRREARV